jgi:nitroreductase
MNEMDVLEAIYTRKSIRRFTGQTISDEDMKLLLKAGCSAPSAHNRQPWHFVIVKNPKALESIAGFHPYAKMLPQAGCGIIICGDEEKQGTTGFLIEDCSAAIENVLLAAHGIGLGAVWCGLYPVPKLTQAVSKLLNLPETIIPVGMVVVGYKAEEKEAVDRFDESKVHYEQW